MKRSGTFKPVLCKSLSVVPTDIAASLNYRPYVALNWIYNSEDKPKFNNSYRYFPGNSNLKVNKFGVKGQTRQNSYAGLIFISDGSNNLYDFIGNIG